MRVVILCAARAILLLFLVCAGALAPESYANEAGKTLHELFSAEWEYLMEQHPTWASSLGDRRWNDRWDNISLDALLKRHDHNVEILDKLAKIDRSALTLADQLNYDLFKKNYENDIERFQYRWYLLPLNQRDGVHTVNRLADALRFETLKDYEDWLARLRALPSRIDQTIALMRQGIKERIIHPKIVLQRVPAQIDHQIVNDPKASPLYKPFTRFPSSITEADQARIVKVAQETIAGAIVPAYRKLKDFMMSDYLPAAWEQVGI